MKLKRRQRHAEQETIVALIDVVFFLLVFFMLIGRMDATAPFNMIPPHGSTGQPLPAGGLTVSVAPDGRFAIDGEILDHDALLDRVSDRLTTDPAALMRVNADRGAALRFVLPLVSDLEAAGAKDVVLIVTPETP